MFIPSLHTSLHNSWRHVYTISCLDNIRRRIYSMWDDMFTPSLNTCLHIVWNMFTHYLRHICSMLKEIHTQCWKTWLKMHLTQFLKTFFNDICKYAYTIFVALFVSCLKAMLCMKTYLHMISSFYTMFEDVLLHCCRHA